MSGSTNFLRDTRRDILRAVREQSMDRTRAMDEYVEALVGVESLKAQVERSAAKADELRRAARDAGNSAAYSVRAPQNSITTRLAHRRPSPCAAATPGCCVKRTG